MHLPEHALVSGAFGVGGGAGGRRQWMDPERQVLVHPKDVTGGDELLVDGGLHLEGVVPAEGALEVAELDDNDRCLGIALVVVARQGDAGLVWVGL